MFRRQTAAIFKLSAEALSQREGTVADTLEQAELRFKLAQKALEDFTQENIIVTLHGSEFVCDCNALELSRRLAALRAECDRAGREWAEALTRIPVEAQR